MKSLGLAFAWALIVHLVWSRFLIDDSIFNFLLRFGAVYFLVSRTPASYNSLFFLGLFLVPTAALATSGDFLFVLSRLSVVAYVLMLYSWQTRKHTLSETLEALLLVAWGLWLCHVLVDPGAPYGGWFKDRVHLDYVPLMGEDGQNYIEFGQSLLKLLTTMYRPPGFPLLTRLILAAFAPNLHLLLVLNVLVLMTTVRLIVQFACAKASWLRLALFVPLLMYFSLDRAASYRVIVTDPINDLLMITHLMFLYRYLADEDRVALKRSYFAMLVAFLVRPTILYYSVVLTVLLVGRAMWRRQNWVSPLRQWGVWILVPLAILLARNRLVHGVVAYSSMQSQVLAYRTYGTMEALRRHLPDVQATFQKTRDELTSWRRQAPPPPHRLSGEGEMVFYDNAFAIKKISSDVPLFLRAWGAGFQSLMFHESGWIDFLIFCLAVALAVTGNDLYFLLLWPVYLICVYSLEGLGTEYRFTLQVLLPCWMLGLKRLVAYGPKLSEGLEFQWPRVPAFLLASILVILVGLTSYEMLKVDSAGPVSRDLLRAAHWSPAQSEWTLRERAPWGRLRTLQLKGLQPELAQQLQERELLPVSYLMNLNPDLPPLASSQPPALWRLSLNGLILASLEEQASGAEQTISLHLAPWLKFWLPLEASVHWVWNSACELNAEQLSVLNSADWTRQTRRYAEKKQSLGRFQPVRGFSTQEEELTSGPRPVAESLCVSLKDLGKSDFLHVPLEHDVIDFQVEDRSSFGGEIVALTPKIPGAHLKIHLAGEQKARFEGLEIQKGFLHLALLPYQ